FTANLVNAINAADPNIFGPGQKFTDPNSDPNVTKSKVLVSTGEKPGKVNVKLSNGKTQEVNLGGDTTTSFWATKSGAPTTTYDFSIGGSASDIAAGWKKILPNYNFGQ
ncbi:MAG: penicillin-binding protein, partial [Carnobacterium sp.]